MALPVRFAGPLVAFAMASLPVTCVAQEEKQTFVTFCNETTTTIHVSYTLDDETNSNVQDVLGSNCFSSSLTSYRGHLRLSAQDVRGVQFDETSISVFPGNRTLVSFFARCGGKQQTPTRVCIGSHPS